MGPAWDHYQSMNFQIPSIGGFQTAAQYQLYPRHVKTPQETLMEKAVRIAETLTGAIKRMMSESTEDIGRHGRALEQLAQIFEKATERLEQSHESRVQTSSTPTTKANLRTTPRVHTRVTRNDKPRIIPTQTTTPIMNTEGGKEFFSHNHPFQRVDKIQRVARRV